MNSISNIGNKVKGVKGEWTPVWWSRKSNCEIVNFLSWRKCYLHLECCSPFLQSQKIIDISDRSFWKKLLGKPMANALDVCLPFCKMAHHSFLTNSDWMCPAQILNRMVLGGRVSGKNRACAMRALLKGLKQWSLPLTWKDTRRCLPIDKISLSKLQVWPHLELDVLKSKCVRNRHWLRHLVSGASYSYSSWCIYQGRS